MGQKNLALFKTAESFCSYPPFSANDREITIFEYLGAFGVVVFKRRD